VKGGRRAERRWGERIAARAVLVALVAAASVAALGMAGAQGVPIPPPRPAPPSESAPDPLPEPLPEPAPQVPAEPVAPPPPPPSAPPAQTRGAVTNLPLPRFVSLKTSEGNARRGPSLSHRIDWVFTRPGMPLRITAEYENWRRVEDVDGIGGWVHYALLSGTRSAVVIVPMADMRAEGSEAARLLARLEAGVIGRILNCAPDWCRIATDGGRGWVRKTALWGIAADELID